MLWGNDTSFTEMRLISIKCIIIMILCCVLSRFYRQWVLLRNWVFLVSFWLAVLLVSQYCPGASILWLSGGSAAYSVMCVCAWRGGGVEVRGLGQCNGGKKCGWGMWWEGKVWCVCEGMDQQSCWVKWNVQWVGYHTVLFSSILVPHPCSTGLEWEVCVAGCKLSPSSPPCLVGHCRSHLSTVAWHLPPCL